MQAIKRLQKELREFEADAPDGMSAGPKSADNFASWSAIIPGPPDSPYEGGIFSLELDYPMDSYPFKPPKATFVTKIFHPNVSEKGEVCLDILKEKWTPALTIGKVLLTISSLMEDPNPDNPLNQEAGSLLSKDPQEFRKVASEWTATYAGGAGVGGSS